MLKTFSRRLLIPALPVVLLIAAAAVVYYLFSLHVRYFQPDEEEYIHLARWWPHALPGSLVELTNYQRGIQRLDVYLLGLPFLVFKSPDAFRFAHLLSAVAFASTAIPTYLLARGLKLGRGLALVPSALSIMLPWAVVATSFLTENVAYPAFVWATYGIWRTLVRPSFGGDLLALVLCAVAVLARTNLLVLAPLPVLSAAIFALPAGRVAQAGGFSGRRWLKRLWGDHALVVGVSGAGVIALMCVLVGVVPGLDTDNLLGRYGLPARLDVGDLRDKLASGLATVVVGLGFVPVIFCVPWLVRALRHPAEREAFAYALVAVFGAALVIATTYVSTLDERYYLYLAPSVFIGLAMALKRGVSPVGVAVTGAAAVALIAAHGWGTGGNPYDFFAFPAERFLGRAVLERIEATLPGLGSAGAKALVGAFLAFVVGACALIASRRGVSRRVGAGVIMVVAAAQLGQTAYALTKFTNGVDVGPGVEQQAWVDRHAGDASVGIWAVSSGNSKAYVPIWREVEFWNTKPRQVLTIAPLVIPTWLEDTYVSPRINPRTGRITAEEPLPGLVVVSRDYLSVGLRGDVVARSTYLPLDLVRVARPASAAWLVTDAGENGSVTGASRARVRFFASSGNPVERQCGKVKLRARAPERGYVGFRVSAARFVETGKLRGEQERQVIVPLKQLAPGRQNPFADVFVTGAGTAKGGKSKTPTLGLARIELGCSNPGT